MPTHLQITRSGFLSNRNRNGQIRIVCLASLLAVILLSVFLAGALTSTTEAGFKHPPVEGAKSDSPPAKDQRFADRFIIQAAADGAGEPAQTKASESDLLKAKLEQGAALGDFNGDGVCDLAAANFFSGDVVILKGAGDGSFTAQSRLSSVEISIMMDCRTSLLSMHRAKKFICSRAKAMGPSEMPEM